MAIAVVDTVSNTATAATSITLSGWTGISENDLLICAIAANDTDHTGWTAETGWDLLRADRFVLQAAVYWRLAPTSFTTVTFDHDSTLSDITAVGIALSGVDTSYPVMSAAVGVCQFNDSAIPDWDMPPMVQGGTNSWAVVAAMIADNTFAASNHQPTGYTSQVLEEANANSGASIATKTIGATVPTSETAGTWTLDTAETYAVAQFLVTEADAFATPSAELPFLNVHPQRNRRSSGRFL